MGLFLDVCAACRGPDGPVCRRCEACLLPPPDAPAGRGGTPVLAAYAYDGVVADLVRALKYRNGRRLVPWFADRLAAVVERSGPVGPDLGPHIGPHFGSHIGVVTWLPTSPQRRRRRGHDQAELLARAVARRLDLPATSLLRRPGGARAQTGLPREVRAWNPTFALRPRGRRRLATLTPGAVVLVIDDVTTTGATLQAGFSALAPFAASVGAVVAQTPARAPVRTGDHIRSD